MSVGGGGGGGRGGTFSDVAAHMNSIINKCD